MIKSQEMGTRARSIHDSGGAQSRWQDLSNLRKLALSFFITKFPAGWNEEMIWKGFEKYGKLVDVYIAKKRSKRGKRFGFVRFLNVEDEKVLEEKLNGVLVDGVYVSVNLAKFERKSNASRVSNHGNLHSRKSFSNRINPGRSYADALKGTWRKVDKEKVNGQGEQRVEDKRQNKQPKIIVVESPQDSIEWLDRCLIGKTKSLEILHNIARIMEADGGGDMKIKYAGGLSVIMEFSSKKASEEFLEIAKETWNNRFTELTAWFGEFGELPKKLENRLINVLVWRIAHRRLPTYENLAKRNIIQGGKQCVLCNLALESEEHIFIDCPVAQCLWHMIAKWWSISLIPHSLDSLT